MHLSQLVYCKASTPVVHQLSKIYRSKRPGYRLLMTPAAALSLNSCPSLNVHSNELVSFTMQGTYVRKSYKSYVCCVPERKRLDLRVCLIVIWFLSSQLPSVPYPTVMSVLIIDNVMVGNQLLEVMNHLSSVIQHTHTYIRTYIAYIVYIRTYIHT